MPRQLSRNIFGFFVKSTAFEVRRAAERAVRYGSDEALERPEEYLTQIADADSAMEAA